MKNLLLIATVLAVGCGGTTEINSELQNVKLEELIERNEILY